MCNLSKGVEEKGIEKGRQEGKRKCCRKMPMSNIKLISAEKESEEKIMFFRKSFIEAGESTINGSRGLHHFEHYNEWIKKVKECERPGNDILGVQATLYMAMRRIDNKIIGCIELRHTLSEDLKVLGGHVGFSVTPKERKKGYATEMLRQVMEKARSLGIPALMLTCDTENAASKRTIMKCGGVLEKVRSIQCHGEEKRCEYYWISLC